MDFGRLSKELPTCLPFVGLFLKVENLLGDKKTCSASFGYPMFSKFPTVSFGTTPQPTNSDHQDYEPFLVGNFYKPSFVTIASWVGG